jgi:hypothetical protein
MNLAALQQDFRSWLVDASNDAAARIGSSATPGLLVYQNNYRSQLVACLEEAFERVHGWLGDEAFLIAAMDHIDRVPPNHWTLDAYPQGFVETLSNLYPEDPEVAELAWLDHALAVAFAGRDAGPLALEALTDIDWDHALLQFTPTLAIGSASTNAAAIWSALTAADLPPSAEILPEPAAVLVWRQGFTSCFRSIDTVERHAIDYVRQGASFGSLCAMLTDEYGAAESVARAGALLGQWLGEGLVVDIAMEDDRSCGEP